MIAPMRFGRAPGTLCACFLHALGVLCARAGPQPLTGARPVTVRADDRIQKVVRLLDDCDQEIVCGSRRWLNACVTSQLAAQVSVNFKKSSNRLR